MARIARWLVAALLLGLASIAQAQSPSGPPPGTQSSAIEQAFSARAQQLPDILSSKGDERSYFAPSFIAAVPITQFQAISAQLSVQHGPVQSVETSRLVTGSSGYVDIRYERSTIRFNLTVAAEPPHQVIGLLVASVKPRGDTVEKLQADLRALAGQSALLVTRLDTRTEPPLFAHNPTASLAIGSSFKLWILAEAARAIAARERRWDEVIRLGKPSLPSGITQKWPNSAPVTLHSLATLMISQSDNTATDTLLFSLGRERVGAMYQAMVNHSDARTLPILSTLEAFSLKTDAYAVARTQWITRPERRNRDAILVLIAPRISAAKIDHSQFGGKPRSIDSVEWFASPADMARTLDWLRVKGGNETLSILAVNPGIPPADAESFAYLGYKGGSEIGVMAMNLLVKTKDGRWYAVCGSWNNTDAAVDENTFVALMIRALALVKP
jgi:beta-lactamase class A